MSHSAENDAPYEVTRQNGLIIAACVCGAGESVIDKGLGRAVVATWRTRHQDCAAPIPPEWTCRTCGAAGALVESIGHACPEKSES